MVDGGEILIFDGKAIVANTGEDTLSFIDLIDRKVMETIDLKKIINNKEDNRFLIDNSLIGPHDMIYSNEGYLYCTNVYSNSIFKMDMRNKKIIDVLYVGSFPTCIKSFQGKIFVANSDSNSISIISEKTFSLIESIPVGEKPIDMEVDREHMKLYIANSNSHNISIIDLIESGNRVVKLDHNPIKIILEDEYIYILSIVNNGICNKSNISIMDRKTYRTQESIDFSGIFNTMLKINGSEIIFITGIGDGYLYRMDMKRGSVLSKTYLKGMPNKLEWDGDSIILITNISTNILTLFDMNTNKIIDNIEVGEEPNGILVFN